MSTLTHYSELVAAWAGQHQVINRAWIFGSYANGTPKPSSDLDVAVELRKTHIGNCTVITYWFRHSSELEAALQRLLPIPLDLELFHRYHGSRICGFVKESNLAPVYRRPRSTSQR